jgi:hypothetical protein
VSAARRVSDVALRPAACADDAEEASAARAALLTGVPPSQPLAIYHLSGACLLELAAARGDGLEFHSLPPLVPADIRDDHLYSVCLIGPLEMDFIVKHALRVTFAEISAVEAQNRLLVAMYVPPAEHEQRKTKPC